MKMKKTILLIGIIMVLMVSSVSAYTSYEYFVRNACNWKSDCLEFKAMDSSGDWLDYKYSPAGALYDGWRGKTFIGVLFPGTYGVEFTLVGFNNTNSSQPFECLGKGIPNIRSYIGFSVANSDTVNEYMLVPTFDVDCEEGLVSWEYEPYYLKQYK